LFFIQNHNVEIIGEHSQYEEFVSRNGEQKKVHVVVKNHPLVIVVSTSENLNYSVIKAKLYYDFLTNSEQKRQVIALKTDPLQYAVHTDTLGKKATAEIIINTLSSQHEGMLFRVMIQVTSRTDGIVELFSLPIRVVSKPCKNKRVAETQEIESTEALLKGSKKKRTLKNSFMKATLTRLEVQQKEQQQLIERLYQQTPSLGNQTGIQDFETTFQYLLRQFIGLAPEQRQNKIRTALSNSNMLTQKQQIFEFVYYLNTEMNHTEESSVVANLETVLYNELFQSSVHS